MALAIAVARHLIDVSWRTPLDQQLNVACDMRFFMIHQHLIHLYMILRHILSQKKAK